MTHWYGHSMWAGTCVPCGFQVLGALGNKSISSCSDLSQAKKTLDQWVMHISYPSWLDNLSSQTHHVGQNLGLIMTGVDAMWAQHLSDQVQSEKAPETSAAMCWEKSPTLTRHWSSWSDRWSTKTAAVWVHNVFFQHQRFVLGLEWLETIWASCLPSP